MNKIAVFGGSFDPVHISHVKIAELVIKVFNFKKIIFVAACCPPHKKKCYASIEDRINMLKLATYEIRENVEISLYETYKKKVYSWETLNYFSSIYPTMNIYMIIGSDSLLDLSNWERIDYIINHYKFIVARRFGIKLINKSVKYLNNCIFLNKEIDAISSTRIRHLVKLNDKLVSKLLNYKVYKYILKNKLYKNV
ncbi:MAG: nicotinate (nicotinamide) nucleotide adenylyltransferase [Endomicrobium sp.]|jgi:nicotinate-nucleotide adenylyltransferase|nr:nicotinate (nicotinamide) nucleotide adenylyltransferase [Endomicrobium sp.]